MIRILAILALAFLISCGETTQGELLLLHGTYFGIPFEVAVPRTLPKADQKKINTIVKSVFSEIDLQCNHWNPKSTVSGMHQRGTYLVSPLLTKLFEVSLQVHQHSDGLFDPVAVSNSKIWKQTKEYTSHCTSPFCCVKIEKSHIVLPDAMSFDFDGIVKGFAVDEIARRLHDAGYSQFLVNWSGEIFASGRHPEGRKWIVFLPHAKRGIELENEALATSGSTYNVWDHNGKVITHIFDPKKKELTDPRLRPEVVTVRAQTCAEADGYATALYINPLLPIKAKNIYLIK